jgi:hypothetical protein
MICSGQIDISKIDETTGTAAAAILTCFANTAAAATANNQNLTHTSRADCQRPRQSEGVVFVAA